MCLSSDSEPTIYTYNGCIQILRQLELYCSRSLDLIYPPGLPYEFSRVKLNLQRVSSKPLSSYEKSDNIEKQLQSMSPEHRVVVCHNPINSETPGIHFIQKSNSGPASCDCIHCYLQNAFPRNVVKKVFAVHVPSVSANRTPKSFSLTMEEYQKIRNDSYRLSLVLLNRIADKWVISGDRPRIWLNRVDINYIQVGSDISFIFLKKVSFIHQYTNIPFVLNLIRYLPFLLFLILLS